MFFYDRADAGARLAERLESYRGEDVLVLGLPRGGVVVASEVARALHAPLDVLVIRKLGAPDQPELAVGAIGQAVTVLNEALINLLHLDRAELAGLTARERRELERREALYRRGHAPLRVRGKTVLLVDDGIATGATAAAAVQVLRTLGAGRVVIAAPIAAPRAVADLGRVADKVVVLDAPSDFQAVGAYYRDFRQVTDDVVLDLVNRSAVRGPMEVRR